MDVIDRLRTEYAKDPNAISVVYAGDVLELYDAALVRTDEATARANAAEAECERLRNENETLREQLDEALAQIESMWKTIAP